MVSIGGRDGHTCRCFRGSGGDVQRHGLGGTERQDEPSALAEFRQIATKI